MHPSTALETHYQGGVWKVHAERPGRIYKWLYSLVGLESPKMQMDLPVSPVAETSLSSLLVHCGSGAWPPTAGKSCAPSDVSGGAAQAWGSQAEGGERGREEEGTATSCTRIQRGSKLRTEVDFTFLLFP